MGVTFAKHRVTTTGVIDVVASSHLSGSYGSVNGFQLVDLSGAPVGTNYCGPAATNSSGTGAVIDPRAAGAPYSTTPHSPHI